MKILHLISNRDNSGGSIAAFNLHNSLLKLGYRSSILSTDKLSGEQNGKGYRRFGGVTGKVQQAFLKLENLLSRPGFINPMDKWLIKNELKDFTGIIHIHVTHVAQTSYDLMNWLSLENRVFWTLHDLWPITAKCIHPTYCTKWRVECNNCPKLREYPNLNWDNTPYLYKQKHDFIRKHNIHFISPSKWIKEMCYDKLSELNGNISIIPHGIDRTIFKKEDPFVVRAELGLPQHGLFVLFPQGRWDDPKKGLSWYIEIKHSLMRVTQLDKHIYLLKIEGDELIYNSLSPSLTEIRLPHAKTKHLMAKYYQMADVSVSVSEIETFGLCIAESLSCTIPVVARTGDGINELLGNSSEILTNTAADLIQLILTEGWRDFDYQKLFETQYSLESWAREHIKLYEA